MDVVERCFHSAINSTKHYLQLSEIVAEFKNKRNVFSHFEINWQAIISLVHFKMYRASRANKASDT